MNPNLKIIALPLALFCGLTLAANTPSSGKGKQMYRWVDAKGQVHFGDKIPPQDAKQGRDNVNNQGVVTKVVPRELTPEERVVAAAQARKDRDAQDIHDRQVAYDRYLVSSYASVGAIQLARQERLSTLSARIDAAQRAATVTEQTLNDLRAQGGATPAAAAKKQIEEYELALIQHLQALRALREEHGTTEIKFASDIIRYKKLKSGEIAPGG